MTDETDTTQTPEPANKTLTIRIPTEIYHRIKEHAATVDRSANYITAQIIAAHFLAHDGVGL